MKKLCLAIMLAATAVVPASAEDFFSTSDPDQLFNIGVRVGLNTSNRTVAGSTAALWNHNSWGTGFDAGVVADINFKNFISVQPGFFYESRSGAYAYETLDWNGVDEVAGAIFQLGKGREYLFTIPIVGSVHFNVMDELRWNVDFGPYFQFKLKSTFDNAFDYPMVDNHGSYYFENVRTAKFDLGLKFGTSLDIYEHYYIGVHYLAGLCHAWNPGNLGGHNKAWTFTIGYNF